MQTSKKTPGPLDEAWVRFCSLQSEELHRNALQLCKSRPSETLLCFLSVPPQQLRAPTARKGTLCFRALAHDEAGLRDHQATAAHRSIPESVVLRTFAQETQQGVPTGCPPGHQPPPTTNEVRRAYSSRHTQLQRRRRNSPCFACKRLSLTAISCSWALCAMQQHFSASGWPRHLPLCEERHRGTIPEPRNRLGHPHHQLHRNIFWRHLVSGKYCYNPHPIRADTQV